MFSEKRRLISMNKIEDLKARRFIEDPDIEVLNNLGINFENDIKIFLEEIRKYFNSIWKKEYYIENNIDSIDELNEIYLDNYPSTAGYYILDSSFTSNRPTDFLNEKSQMILGYLYNIHLR